MSSAQSQPATTDGSASDWSSATLAALYQPTSTTAGFVNADGSASETSGAGGKHVGATATGSTGTVVNNDPTTHTVKATPFAADFNAGMGGMHASGGLPSQPQGLVTGGGLATSSNVPAPGATVGTRAGLTRMESDALIAAGHEVPTNTTSLSGWEQAEAQLRQLGIRGKPEAIIGGSSAAALTPGQEVPGGWGATHASEHPTTTLYQDVSTALDKVGHAAYAAVPQGIKDAMAGYDQQGGAKVVGGQPHSTAPDVFRQAQATAASLAAQAQSAAEIAAQRAHQAFEEAKRGVQHNAGTGPLAGGAVTEAKTVVAVPGTGAGAGSAVGGAAPSTSAPASAPTAASLPTDELVGQKPGEHTEGVGKLPGAANETGVAVLPDEKAAVGGATDKSRDVGAVTRVGESSSGLPAYDGELAPPLGVFNEATPLPTQTSTSIPQGVTAAIPQQPVAKAADVVAPETSAATIPTSSAASTSVSEAPRSSIATDASTINPPATNRLDSSISTTAIRGGQPGDLHGSKGMSASSTQTSLPTIGESALPDTPAAQVSTSTGTGPSVTTSRTPGNEQGAVGSHANSAVAPPTPPKQASNTAPATGGHGRNDSTSSSGKKQGLFSKIKAKLHHDK